MIIGISGKAGSGKDTLAFFIEERSEARILHFADPLKMAVCTMAGLSYDDVYTQEGKQHTIDWLDGITVRELLQKVGTAVRNEIHPEFWIRRLLESSKNSKATLLVPDVRFPNEADAIKNAGGFLIRLERNGAGAGNHISETALDNYDKWDMVIQNNYDLDYLKDQAKNIIKLLNL